MKSRNRRMFHQGWMSGAAFTLSVLLLIEAQVDAGWITKGPDLLPPWGEAVLGAGFLVLCIVAEVRAVLEDSDG